MYTVYTADGEYLAPDASAALTVYQRELDAGAHPSLWRGAQIIVHITTCKQCGEIVLLTHADVCDWVGAFGELEDGVLCEGCLNQMLDAEEAAYEQEASWEREVELYCRNMAHIEQ